MRAFPYVSGLSGRRLSLALLAIGAVVAILSARWLATPTPVEYLPEKVQFHDLETTVLATGTLQAVDQVDVGTRVTGQLKTLNVKLGDHVHAGDLLAVIDPRLPENDLRVEQANLARLEADRRAAVARQKRAKLELDRQKQMMRGDVTTKRDLQSAEQELLVEEATIASLDAQIAQAHAKIENAATNLAYTKIVAPIDGNVIAILVRVGQTVVATQIVPVILKLANLDTMTVKTQISEGDVTRVQVGQTASFKILSEPDRTFSGVLRAVEPAPQNLSEAPSPLAGASASGAAGSSNAVFYNAQFEVPNPKHFLRIGMTAQVSIRIGDARKVLAIPVAALGERVGDGQFVVRVAASSGRIESRQIRTGANNHILVEILDGLSEGEFVIVGERIATRGGR